MKLKFKNENGNVKIMIAVIIVLVAIIIGIVIFKMSAKDRTVAVIEQEPYEYFTLYSLDEKVGIVDKKGKTLIEPEYTTIYIPNQSKEVFFCFKGDEYRVLDSKGKDIFTEFSSVSPITISDTSLEMEKQVLCYEENGKLGLVDFEGKKLSGAIYEKVESLKNKPGCILVKKDGMYGVVDSYGNTVVDIKYNSVKSDEFCSETEGYLKTGYIVTEKTKSGIILTSSAQEKPQEAEVIAVGPGGMVDGKEVVMQVKEGQKVIYSKYSGTEVKLDGQEYIIVRQNDILAVVE